MLPIPITVDSKLKLIKKHLWSTTGDERLALLSIESDSTHKLDLEVVLVRFYYKKVRKVSFQQKILIYTI